ncbi:MAG: hypothetical protein ACRCU0_03735 [Candidatus Rhabdochlamydia sp.]
MSVFPFIELTQKFFNSDPFEFDTYFSITPDYQKKYCLGANAFTRFTVGVVGKELALLTNDIALHLLAGAFKLAIGGLKSVSTIAAVVFSQELDYQTPIKEGVVHLGFVCLYALDFFASIANIGNRYPQYLVDKTRNVFANFLKASNKNMVIQQVIIADPKIAEELKATKEELKKRDADFNELAEEIENTTEELNKPSQCEKIVDEILNPDTKNRLAKVKDIKKNNEAEKNLNWFESENEIKKRIASFTQKNTGYPAVQRSLFIDDDELEQTFMELAEPIKKEPPIKNQRFKNNSSVSQRKKSSQVSNFLNDDIGTFSRRFKYDKTINRTNLSSKKA